jgi:hypothetical protein
LGLDLNSKCTKNGKYGHFYARVVFTYHLGILYFADVAAARLSAVR